MTDSLDNRVGKEQYDLVQLIVRTMADLSEVSVISVSGCFDRRIKLVKQLGRC